LDELEPGLSALLDAASLSFARQLHDKFDRSNSKLDVAFVIECKLIGAFVWQGLKLGFQQTIERNEERNSNHSDQDSDAA